MKKKPVKHIAAAPVKPDTKLKATMKAYTIVRAGSLYVLRTLTLVNGQIVDVNNSVENLFSVCAGNMMIQIEVDREAGQ